MSILFQPHPFKFGLTVHHLRGGLQILPVLVLSSTPFSVQASPIVPLPPAKVASHSSLTESISQIEAVSTSLQQGYTARDLLPHSEPHDFDQIIRQLTAEEDSSPWQVADAVAPDDETEASQSKRWTSSRPDGHAPIGVMGDHTHSAGEVMLSYRYMRMGMSGNLDGTTNLTPTQVLQQFPVTPLRMTMDMHMFGVMYAPTDTLTLMGMVPYITKEMDHLTRMGTTFTTRSSGLGDVSLSGLVKVFDKGQHRIHLNFGSSFPTGSTNKRDDTPAGPNQVLPYPMQLGSGTVDLRPGLTYLGQSDTWSWGGQVLGTVRLGDNENNYRLGNEINGTAWGAKRWNDWISTSLRLNAKNWGDISGADPRLNPTLIPTANPDLRGGTRLDLGVGLNLFAPKGRLKGGRFGLELALPVYQSLDGPQLETDWLVTAGLQYAF